MRRFHSYGPVDPDLHCCVPRTELVSRCVAQLVGSPEKGGSYFTIWAPRQTGKTWLMRSTMDEVRAIYGDRFLVGAPCPCRASCSRTATPPRRSSPGFPSSSASA